MDPKLRRVTAMPLTELFDESGVVPAQRGELIDEDVIRRELDAPSIALVIANIGHRMRWVPGRERFRVWKEELRGRVVPSPDEGFDLDDAPDGYAFVASRWKSDAGDIFVFEMFH